MIKLERVSSSGGHSHPGGPTGFVKPSEFVLTGTYPQNFRVAYRAPEVAGLIKMVATFSDGSTDTDYNKVIVKDLVMLASSNSIVLIGSTTKHPDNHYGLTVLCKAIERTAADFFGKFKKPLFVNDMALPWGGLFDISGAWTPPHRTHIDGRRADLRSKSMSQDEKAYFQQRAGANGLSVLLEDEGGSNEHWHVTI